MTCLRMKKHCEDKTVIQTTLRREKHCMGRELILYECNNEWKKVNKRRLIKELCECTNVGNYYTNFI